jgi:hypothetical protein
MKPMTRRAIAGAAACVGAATLVVPSSARAEEVCDPAELASLRERVRILSYNTASGGGVNLKLMPDPTTGEPTVPLAEVFSFDRNHALCRVDTNPQAFAMPTFEMGQVSIAANQFFMAMEATTIEQYAVQTNADGSRVLTMRGGLGCATEVGQATLTIGSRTEIEHATYRIEAVDGGIGGGAAGDHFAFTVFFDPEEAPVNHAVFGPEFTFTGEMVAGEITIVDPNAAAG